MACGCGTMNNNVAFIQRYYADDSLARKVELLFSKVCGLQGQIDTINSTLSDYPQVRAQVLSDHAAITNILNTQQNIIANFNQLVDVVSCISKKVQALETATGTITSCNNASAIQTMKSLLGA